MLKPRMHARAKISDAEVELIRRLVDEAAARGEPRTATYAWLAAKFELHPRTIKKYVYFERRFRAY